MKKDLVEERSENGETNILFFKLEHARNGRVCDKKRIFFFFFSPRDGVRQTNEKILFLMNWTYMHSLGCLLFRDIHR